MRITKIYKRDGSVVPFNQKKITNAIYKAAAAVGGHDLKKARELSGIVVNILENHFPKTIPTVEEVQDIVEKTLIEQGHAKTAKAYILYRQERRELREQIEEIKKIRGGELRKKDPSKIVNIKDFIRPKDS